MFRIIRPTLRVLRVFGQTIWVLLRGGWQTVIWNDLSAGSVALTDSVRSFRLLIRLGLWLTIVLLVTMLFGDAWRLVSPLLPLPFFNDALAGNYTPQLLVPVILGLLALAWAYLLSGALHIHWIAKLIVLVLFAVFDLSLILTSIQFSMWTLIVITVHLVAWLALLLLFVIRWKRSIRLGLEFPLTLLLTAALFFSSYLGALLGARTFQSEIAIGGLQIYQTLNLINVLLVPFLLIAGAEVAELALEITQAVSERTGHNAFLAQGSGRLVWALALAAFLGLRLLPQWIVPLFTAAEIDFSWGAVVIILVLLMVFVWASRHDPERELPQWVIIGAAAIMYVVLLVIQIAGFVVGFVFSILIATSAISASFINQFLAALNNFLAVVAQWNEVFVSGFAGLVGLLLWVRARRRQRPLPAATLYAFLFAAWLLWWLITRSNQPLGALSFDYTHISSVTTIVLIGFLLIAALTRRLRQRTLLHLSAAAILFWLLEFQNILSDPLSPAFGLLGAEALFVSVGSFLGVMAAGTRFGLNLESPGFPRYTRAMLYFGYAILTVTTLNWLTAGHQASAMALNEQTTQNGFIAIGLPLAFWALLTGSEDVLGSSVNNGSDQPDPAAATSSAATE